MLRRTLTLGSALAAFGVLLVPFALPARADRETGFSDIPRSGIGHELAASLAIGPRGALAAAWSTDTRPGPLQGAVQVDGRWQRWTRKPRGQVRGVAVAYDGNGIPTVAWADDAGLNVAPAGGTGAATSLVGGAADAVALARLRSGGLVAAVLVPAQDGEHLWVATRSGSLWAPRDLGVVSPPAYPGAPALQIAAYGSGFAVSFLDGARRLVLQAYDAADPEAPGKVLALPVGRHAEARLATAADGSVWVIFGGQPTGKKRGEYGFAHLAEGHLHVHVLERQLQCDRTAYLVGVGWLGSDPRLMYGYGCDVGWQLHTLNGRITTDPSTGADTVYAVASASAAGRIAALVVTQRDTGAHLATALFGR